MRKYKKQAESSLIGVSSSIASVSYNLYNKVKYHDPKNENFDYNRQLVNNLSMLYYQDIKEILECGIFTIDFVNVE